MPYTDGTEVYGFDGLFLVEKFSSQGNTQEKNQETKE
jgi:hypothetical protein